MTSLIAAAVLFAILGAAVRHIYKEKKRGAVCIGCPHADACARKRAGCGCHGDAEDKRPQ